MRGPFVLSRSCVNMLVPPQRLGVFALSNDRDTMVVLKRADKSTNEEIKSYFSQYKYFWFDLASSAKEAFSIECELFHTPAGQAIPGETHPKAPNGSGWHCPVCKT